ncbi:MBL fold metallo-hydrolase [Maribellus luteus]|uniref:MBL fold metallo-hydrolase n=1 Tax=Maribellus luteus TaxID=2305463 RepID=A0A399T5A1_9BACT|nr:MBL fold metallo-hydrolase [Maribellus luteus]RIJ49962.1 MBL fold metallo-hydrolase [Maribellus luteus]
MKVTPISAGNFHCDGGALFGVIPKVLWSKVYPSDENNFTKLALRCLLVETANRKILIETGIGDHYPDKHLQNNGVSSVNKLGESIKKAGISNTSITDVFFTHLHWDHCTGAVKNTGSGFQLRFPNATHWCSLTQWEHTKTSNPRERTAFHYDILKFLYNSGQLKMVENEGELFPGFQVRFVDGHTPGQMIPLINAGGKTFAYMSDLIPTAANIPLLWISAYDLDPVKVMSEKQKFLEEAAEKDYILFFEHDYYTECATLTKSEKGVVVKEKFALKDLVDKD